MRDSTLEVLKENDLYPETRLGRAMRVFLPSTIRSIDNRNTKYLQVARDGQFIETGVFDHRNHPDWDGDKHLIVCFSSQVGCDQRCPFCATGAPKRMPWSNALIRLVRNLSAEEIVDQVSNVVALSGTQDDDSPLLLSAMGMGEPFDNFNAVYQAIGELGARWRDRSRATISTICRPEDQEAIRRLAASINDGELPIPVKMHFSLHGPDDETRRQLVPRGGSVQELLDTAYEFAQTTGTRPKLNYVLMAGKNDTTAHAQCLVEVIQAHPIAAEATVKISHLNTYGTYLPSSDEVAAEFQRILEEAGVSTTRFSSAVDGGQVEAGCGQLQKRVLSELIFQNPR